MFLLDTLNVCKLLQNDFSGKFSSEMLVDDFHCPCVVDVVGVLSRKRVLVIWNFEIDFYACMQIISAFLLHAYYYA